MTVIERTHYFARPGLADLVLATRRRACGAGPRGIFGAQADAAAVVGDQAGERSRPRRQVQPSVELVGAAGERDLARRDRMAIDRRVAHPAGEVERHGREHMTLEPKEWERRKDS